MKSSGEGLDFEHLKDFKFPLESISDSIFICDNFICFFMCWFITIGKMLRFIKAYASFIKLISFIIFLFIQSTFFSIICKIFSNFDITATFILTLFRSMLFIFMPSEAVIKPPLSFRSVLRITDFSNL